MLHSHIRDTSTLVAVVSTTERGICLQRKPYQPIYATFRTKRSIPLQFARCHSYSKYGTLLAAASSEHFYSIYTLFSLYQQNHTNETPSVKMIIETPVATILRAFIAGQLSTRLDMKAGPACSLVKRKASWDIREVITSRPSYPGCSSTNHPEAHFTNSSGRHFRLPTLIHDNHTSAYTITATTHTLIWLPRSTTPCPCVPLRHRSHLCPKKQKLDQ